MNYKRLFIYEMACRSIPLSPYTLRRMSWSIGSRDERRGSPGSAGKRLRSDDDTCDSPCPKTLELSHQERSSRREQSQGPLTRWPDNRVDAKSDRACPGHGAAGVRAGKGKPEPSLENQSSNVLKLKARVASWAAPTASPPLKAVKSSGR
jgi:hypothetical protein